MDNSIRHVNDHTTVVANAEVWLEGEAERQLEKVASEPGCVAAVGMPDLHPGPGVPIGAVFGFRGSIAPRLVGSDAGCGALVVALGKLKVGSSLERRVRAEFDGPALLGCDRDALARAVWDRGPAGLGDGAVSEAGLAIVRAIAGDHDGEGARPSGEIPNMSAGAALGTIGGGNHFAEIGRVCDVIDRQTAEAFGLKKGSYVVLCHSGSRGLGKALSDKWAHQDLAEADADTYLGELAGAVRFARANRVVLADRLLRALGVSRASKIAGAFDVVHNSVVCEACAGEDLWVHRKGCAPAHDGQLTAVLGTRGTPSWIMRGRGADPGLSSVAHGAGRKMRRSEARDKLKGKYRKKELAKGRIGQVICDDTRLLYEEHPDAYKSIGPVIDSLEQAGLATRVAAIEPLLTVKK